MPRCRFFFPAIGIGLAALLAAASLQAQQAGPAQAADSPATTASGNTLVVPREWVMETRGAARVLLAPEGDSRIAVVDVRAADADVAVAAAWAVYDPQFRRPLKLASDRPPRDGWQQVRSYTYETSANEQRVVFALALRGGGGWTVAIEDASIATDDKRSAQFALVFDRLWPAGYQRESFAGRTAHRLDAARLQALKDFVVQAQRELEVPGVALGIVQDGHVVFSGGFGQRALGRPEPVDGDTLFMIASNTKALSTLMLAKLVEQGRFGWDTPVVQLYPGFRLGDADTTRKVQVRHLVCACTGLPRQDMEFMFEGEKATPESAMALLGTMRPTSGFGELYQYSNLMAMAAGYVGAQVLAPAPGMGEAYDEAMQSLVFAPLGMTATTFDSAAAQRGNHASPHAIGPDARTHPAGMAMNEMISPFRPAGGAWSSANDLLRYVQMELAEGLLPDGTRYISSEPLLERRRKQVASGDHLAYGMGLETDTGSGVAVVHHGGSAWGFQSDMLWIPEAGVGAVVLANADLGRRIVYPFSRRLLEVLYDGKPEAAESVSAFSRRYRDRFAVERRRLSIPAQASASNGLASRYRNAALGEIAVSRRGDATWFDTGGWASEVATRRNDDGSLSFVTVSPGYYGDHEFAVAGTGAGATLVVRDAQHEYVFEAVR